MKLCIELFIPHVFSKFALEANALNLRPANIKKEKIEGHRTALTEVPFLYCISFSFIKQASEILPYLVYRRKTDFDDRR